MYGQWWWGDMERMGNGREAAGSGERKFFYWTCGCPMSARSVLAYFKPLFGLFLKMQRCREKLENFFENYLFFPETFSPEMECRTLEKLLKIRCSCCNLLITADSPPPPNYFQKPGSRKTSLESHLQLSLP